MNARVQEIESDAGDVEPLRPGAKREYGLRLVGDREWTEAFLAGERRILEMIAKGESLVPILDAMCRLVEEMSSGSLATILLLDADGKSLRHAAAPSLPASYTEGMGAISVAPSLGSCGTAAYRREPVIATDIAKNPLWDGYRDLPLAHGLRATWSTPIFSPTHEVMGTFALYSRKPGDPTPEQRNLIEQMTHLAAVAIERERAEVALRRSESRFEGILRITEDAIISVDSSQRILLFNQGAEKVFGYPATEVIGKPLDVLLPQRFAHAHRGHVQEFDRSPEVSRTMAQRREVFGRRKDGREFPAEASISKLQVAQDVVFTVILRDITERKEAAEALRASAQLARGQTEALTRTLDALAKESAPDRVVEHVLRTITEQLEAHSSSIWLRNDGTDRVSFEFAFEGGRLLTKSDAARARISPTLKIEDVWPWQEIFRTGKPGVLEDIRQGPSFPWRDHVLPDGLSPADAAPLLCAGVTTFNALRNSGARPGDVVAVLGVGGLGHLGVQYAAKAGFNVVAIARGKDKEPLARQLGAAIYIDSQSQDPAAELIKLGGASVVISTVTSGEAMSVVQGGLAINGTLLLLGVAESMKVSPMVLLAGKRSVKGWYSGTAIDSQDTLAFSARTGVRSMN
jgi:PAS domain S-box-containing protein